MPPRKRARRSQNASPTPTSQPKTPTPAESSPGKEQLDVLNDPWTDEEEIGLFKGLIRWKPTGIHKHFHLMNLHRFMLENGYIHPRNEHTRPARIWQKLQTMYNLEALDEREDARQLDKMELDQDDEGANSDGEDEDADVYSEAANKIDNEDFHLSGMEFEELKWANRLASDEERRDESPPILPELNMAEEPPVRFTPSFSVEPSEVATPKGRARAGTATSTKGKPAAAATRKSTRKAGSAADDGEEQEEEAEEDGEGTEDEEEENEEESERSTPATRSTRSRGRPPTRSKGRGRGRGK